MPNRLLLTRSVTTYNRLLAAYPLLTKSATGAVLSALGELISQSCSSSASTQVKRQTPAETPAETPSEASVMNRIRAALATPQYSKLLLMFLYGALVNAPINHFSYKWINRFTNTKVIARWRRLAQLCGSWVLVTPVQVFLLLVTLTLVNMGQAGGQKLARCLPHLKENLRARYVKMLSSSLVSSTVFVSFAQQLIPPEKWSVFFSFAYAALGTGQNMYLKKHSSAEKKGDASD